MKLLHNEKTTHLIANCVPRNIRTKIVSIWNGNNPHETLVRLRARGFVEYILGGPIDELGPASVGTYAGIVEVRFELRNVVGARLDSGGTRDTVIAEPEAFILGATTLI